MKFRILLFFLLAFVKIFACKCSETPSLQSSFAAADFVFMGEIYDIIEVPSGFKTAQSVLSKVKMNRIYKSGNYNGFYTQTATLSASPINSCDVFFTEKGKYLIFAYDKENSDFLSSSLCFVQKRVDQLSQEELKELERLSTEYKNEAEKAVIPDAQELIENFTEEASQPNKNLNELTKEISFLRQQNDRYRIIIYTFSLLIVLFLITLLIVWKRKK